MSVIVLGFLAAIFSNPHSDAPLLSGQGASSELSGSCIGERGPINLSRALVLENRSLEWTGSSGPIRITLQRQSVIIALIGSPDGDTYPRNIGSLVAQGQDNADIFLKLVLLENEPIVYWRETFQHRIYRQGMFRVVGHSLTRLCDGEAGETVLD